MKKLIIALSMLVVSAVHAGEIKIEDFNESQLNGPYSVSQVFEVNQDLGRAWVKFSISNGDPEAMNDEYRVKVAGLTYDVASSEVRIELDGNVTACATNYIRGPRIFKTRSIRTTGNCTFERRVRTVSYDDGFEVKQTRVYSVYLVTK
jgi:hypothetical protein